MSSRTSKSRAEVNATLLKSLLKLPGNKYCSDCKTADHPRWASWNLGIFLCIRCSGVHRSMGTHISRVKSVDLDAWTDEQAQSMLKWGNKKANTYWEAKLDAGHVPSEGKIDNYIKTKYVSKRWVSQGDLPDPNDLSGDEDIPPKAVPVSRASTSNSAIGIQGRHKSPVRNKPASQMQPPAQPIDSLLGMEFFAPTNANTEANIVVTKQPSTTPTTQPTNQSNLSLLSDSVSIQQAQPIQQGRSNQAPRNDLKMSIMSLYASAPKPQQHSQVQMTQPLQSYPSISATTAPPAQAQKVGGAFDDLSGLFGGMNVQAASSSSRLQNIPPAVTHPQNAQRAYPNGDSAFTNHPSPKPDPVWTVESDVWGGFQSETSTQAPSKNSAFDDLYSTSDVWK